MIYEKGCNLLLNTDGRGALDDDADDVVDLVDKAFLVCFLGREAIGRDVPLLTMCCVRIGDSKNPFSQS